MQALTLSVTRRTLLWMGRRSTIDALYTPRQTRTLSNAWITTCGRDPVVLPSATSTGALPHLINSRISIPGTPSAVQVHYYSNPAPKQSSTQRIKVILKDYGSVAVIFHTVMSLASLGTCYLVVNSGVDVGKVLEYFNVQSSAASKGASTFAVAYVLHKMLLPLRAAITVGAVPLIVRWLRTRGWIKTVVKQVDAKS